MKWLKWRMGQGGLLYFPMFVLASLCSQLVEAQENSDNFHTIRSSQTQKVAVSDADLLSENPHQPFTPFIADELMGRILQITALPEDHLALQNVEKIFDVHLPVLYALDGQQVEPALEEPENV